MDTGVSTHTSASQGNLSSYLPLSNSHQKVIVGNGHSIPIHGTGHTQIATPYKPLHLNNVLHAPNIIKNLISVRRLTTNNNVSVSFDPFGFTVSDFQTGMPFMRCDIQSPPPQVLLVLRLVSGTVALVILTPTL